MRKQKIIRWEMLCALGILAVLILLVVFVCNQKIHFLYCYYSKNGTSSSSSVEGPFSVELNLKDLESNCGKVLYQKDGCIISVRMVRRVHDRYSVYFTCVPEVSLSGLTWITPYGDGAKDMPQVSSQNGMHPAWFAGFGVEEGPEWNYGYHLNDGDDSTKLADMVTLTFSSLNKECWE